MEIAADTLDPAVVDLLEAVAAAADAAGIPVGGDGRLGYVIAASDLALSRKAYVGA
jgi:hypothetical protein